MSKRVWITSLVKDEKLVQPTMSGLRGYGLEVGGHFWADDLQQMAWLAPREEMTRDDLAVWLILCEQADLGPPSVRLGLALLAITVQSTTNKALPIILAHRGAPPDPQSLSTALAGAQVVSLEGAGLGAKVVARANIPAKRIQSDYRLSLFALPRLGLWFEVGPAEEGWDGALFGVHAGEIDAHGTGTAGKLPDRAVLEYPMKGLKLELGEREYTAWAVRNRLEKDASYYVRVTGEPTSLLFGPFPEDDSPELYSFRLI